MTVKGNHLLGELSPFPKIIPETYLTTVVHNIQIVIFRINSCKKKNFLATNPPEDQSSFGVGL